ncbi:receptor-like serine/threonine-protein kinase SD1-7 isoform X1 [Sesamum indicum]|uniref:Receptor-like serine/threonine-protein kinase SD1-7 isoform X1 n=1 Tax=Sesamum indicum TaxID=4182 RepID=A0A6I9T489_SESIN|nr:receptor-like serine/threonine-protein kinase SD1-7 isoform X1 [Sesamum indicum]
MFKINICLLLFLSLLKFSEAETWIRSGYWYSGSEFPVPDINSELFTHLVCAFAHINTSSYEINISPSDEPYMSTFTEIVRRKNPSAKTLLSIWAGANSSSTFFDMISRSSSRRAFIESSITAAREHGFMGLDLFDVFPSTPANMTNMESFLDEWKEAIDSEPKHTDTSPLILTMGAKYLPVMESTIYPLNAIRRTFDWVHVLSFDYHLPSKDRFTGAHAALYDPSSNLSTDYGINEWIRRGLPANKLVLGLPYHGYAWTLVNPNDYGIGAPAKGVAMTPDGSISYRHIKWYLNSYGVQPTFNSTYVVNYCKIGSFWIGFDDVEVVKIKVSYAKQKGLLGYSVFQVPNDDMDWTLSRTAKEEEEDQNLKHELRVILLSTTFAAILLLGTILCCLKRKFIMSKVKGKAASGKTKEWSNLQVFSFTQIAAATDNFSCENKLGEGGFGSVYKGELNNGLQIAIKRLSKGSTQGTEELKNELALTTRLQHVNLVKVLGICTEREEQMLVYEYMPNRSLDMYLFDPVKRLCLDWQKRVQIIDGVTQGLLYLQEYSQVTIIHRDLKASNILLDKEMKPKISDFGIARIFQKDENAASTRRIIGTYGYVPPEYVKGGIYSRKYDVYSFGVLLLQIISGKKTSCLYGVHKNINLLQHAYELWRNDNSIDFMDPSLDDTSSTCKMKTCMQVALLCVQERWQDRPSMLEVSSMLKNETDSVPVPNMPAFSTCRSPDSQNICSSIERCSANMLTITQEIPR